MPDLLTTRQLAEYLQLSERSVYRLLERGELPAVRVGGQWRFRKTHPLAHPRENIVGIRALRKQTGDPDLRPQRIFVPMGFKPPAQGCAVWNADGCKQQLVGGIFQRHRDRAPFLERVRERLGARVIDKQFQFEPRHGSDGLTIMPRDYLS